MHKLLTILVIAFAATAVQSHEGSVGSHQRMIKRVAIGGDKQDLPILSLDKRTEHGKDCGSSKWVSSGSWSHSQDKAEEHTPHHHGHHHSFHHHAHHQHSHHHHHHAAKDQGKETAATAKSKDQKPEQKKEIPKQDPPKEKAKPKEHHDHGASSSGSGGGGLLDITFDGQCPHPKATAKHPNGCIEFLNCNIDNSGWTPPHVKIEHLKIASPDEVVKGHFKPCAKYLGFFKSVAKEFNIHATILMSIAMQESHCDAGLTGPNGEISLMQIIPENCRGNCWDVYNNIRLGAIELDDHLKHHDGNFLLAAGEYNGWTKGMTTGEVKKEKWGCYAQQNLDYLHQLANGWLQGLDGYSNEFLVYNNLGHCK